MDRKPYYGLSSDEHGKVMMPMGDRMMANADGETLVKVDKGVWISSEGKIVHERGGQMWDSSGGVYGPMGGGRRQVSLKTPQSAKREWEKGDSLNFVIGLLGMAVMLSPVILFIWLVMG